MAVEKEYWTGKILEKPIPDGSFLLESEDWSIWSDGKVLHFAEAGLEPEVLLNNNTYPVGIVKRSDVPKDISLDTYDTKNTQHTNLEKIEESDQKANSIVRGHKSQIHKASCKLALYNWCPQKNTVDTPVLETTGANVTEGAIMRKRLTYADIIALETRFRDIDLAGERLVLCLCNKHLEDLKLEDVGRYEKVLKDNKLGAFVVYNYSNMPTFSATTKEKEAFAAAKSPASMPTSIAWQKSEVMRCNGEVQAFITENDPQYRGDLIGFQKRFIALSLRNFGIAAIYSAKV